MKLDILAIAAHPDDVELACSGTLISHVNQGRKVGVLDLTQGELGTRGTPEIRKQEAIEGGRLMGLSVRDNLAFRDVFFLNDEEHQIELVKKIRHYQPEIVLANAISDRHPDHPKSSKLISQACFMAGLKKIETEVDGSAQKEWRPKAVYHYIQSNYVQPDLIVDISATFDKKMESIKAYKSQFYNPESGEPETFISSKQFLDLQEARATEFGKAIGVKYGEGFNVERFIGVKNLFDLI
ncbi:MAG: bacillithiol biosynthesis deacetylase BshB1 [Cyclobacteriaceae bacterium]